MNREYAALLAQVIPVVALALVWEVRSMVEKIRSSGRDNVPTWRLSFLLFLLGTLFVLGVAELRALAVVAGGLAFLKSWTYLLAVAIFVAFLAPGIDILAETVGRSGIDRIRQALGSSTPIGTRIPILIVLILIAAEMVVALLAIAGSMF